MSNKSGRNVVSSRSTKSKIAQPTIAQPTIPKSKVAQPTKAPIKVPTKVGSSQQTPKEGYCFTYEDLRYLQSLPLHEKVQKTQMKILQWCLHWDWNVYLSFSGGKDSTVLYDLVRRVEETFNKEIPAVFCDTGLEYPEIRQFVKSYKRVDWVRPVKPFSQVIKEFGYPVFSKDVAQTISGFRKGWASSKRKLSGLNPKEIPNDYIERKYGKYRFLVDAPFLISDQCCDELKKKPLKKYEKETGRKCMTAQMAQESIRRRTTYLRNGCNAFHSLRPMSHPMGFWTEQDVLRYCKEFNLPLAPVYGNIVEVKKGKLETTGLDRSGCIFCMFGIQREKTPNRFQRLKNTHPGLYRYCMNQLGCKKVLDYIGIDY
ncbi:MAG: phosphoadenosine phosphosulfate reductase family protein [Thermoguttaceae bacterium]